ncbi:MAG: chemotaxis protein CheD [Spirochaetales bacterium]|nr:chemotaxis protein CheD [Spirochaetales bacterium]
MYHHRLSGFDVPMVTIHPGEFWVTSDDVAIVTVLGSCVSVALRDRSGARGGLNHFMLTGDLKGSDLARSPDAKYGMYAMELLINELIKAGSAKRDLEAKVFGGASVLRLAAGSPGSRLHEANVAFALDYLKLEGIPLLASDTGGFAARKIFFFPRTGRVLLKRFGGAAVAAVERAEEGYLSDLRRHPPEGDVVLFGGDKEAARRGKDGGTGR